MAKQDIEHDDEEQGEISLDNTKRHPYRILKGTYTRRDGEPNKHEGAGVRSHRQYNIGDDVDMTDKEAFHYGLDRLKRLSKRNVKTVGRRDARQSSDGSPADAEGIQALIAAGEEASGASESREWRKTVVESGVLGDEDAVPTRKGDVLEALKTLLADRAE